MSLTGSERAGAAVAEIAGRNLKKVVLELGGSDPFLLLGTDDMDAAVESAVAGASRTPARRATRRSASSSSTSSTSRSSRSSLPPLDAVKPGDPTSPDTTIGPLSSTLAADRLEEQVKRAVDQGANARRRRRPRRQLLLDDRPHRHHAGQRRLPRGVLRPGRLGVPSPSEEEAVELANDTPFGLGSYVMTNNPDQALRVADKIEAGMVFVNAVGAEGAELPFGGVKRSGFGASSAASAWTSSSTRS